MKVLFLLLSAFQLFSISAFSAELRGTITNEANGKPVAAVIVKIESINAETSSDDRGMYALRDLPKGRFVVNFSHEGFIPYSFEQQIDDASRAYGRDIELKPLTGNETSAEYMREQPKYRLPDVDVLTNRAGREHPVTYTNMSQQEIKARSYGQDTPLLLEELPNVSAYSEGGAGMGYSYLRMRGFPQDHVAVQINGVPLNDAETGEVFWVDLPDLAEDLNDIQVQRGIGSSLYGTSAFGGSINMLTRTPGVGDRAMIRAEGTYGSWNTQRGMVEFQSGRIQNRYGFSGRFTRMATNGYRENAWAKLWSYYLSAARFTPHHTTTLNFYGGPEQTHLAYEGVNKDYLEGKITGDMEHDRRFNEFTYPGAIDNFYQPHYEIHDEWKATERVKVENSLYLFKGDGYYDQWQPGMTSDQYFYNYQPVDTIDVLQRRNISELDGGWIPRASVDHKYGTTVFGGEIRLHQAHHEGIVNWASVVPEGIGPNYHYYDYHIHKTSLSGFVHNLFNITSRLHALADVQLLSHDISMRDDRLWGVQYEKTYTSINPRAGLNYLLRESNPAGTIYGSLSLAQHEPKPDDIYDPQDFYSIPIEAPGHFASRGVGYDYTGPSLKPEKLTDVEVGTEWRWLTANVGLNLYYMRLRDALVPYGALDNLGLPVTINAKETLHQGLEVVGGIEPLNGFKLNGNVALTDHRFVHHEEYDWTLGMMVKRDGNRVGFDPIYVANGRVEYSYKQIVAGIGVRSVGKQYVDNSQDEETAVSPYTIFALDVGYRFTQIPGLSAGDVKVRINNLFNREYEANGYNYGEARYIVGAPKSAFVTLGVEALKKT